MHHKNPVQNSRLRTKPRIWLQLFVDRVHHHHLPADPVVRIVDRVTITARNQRNERNPIDGIVLKEAKDPSGGRNRKNMAPIAVKRIKNGHNAKVKRKRHRCDQVIVKKRHPNENHDLVVEPDPNRLSAPNFSRPNTKPAVPLLKQNGTNCREFDSDCK